MLCTFSNEHKSILYTFSNAHNISISVTHRKTPWPELQDFNSTNHIDMACGVLFKHILDIIRSKSFFKLSFGHQKWNLHWLWLWQKIDIFTFLMARMAPLCCLVSVIGCSCCSSSSGNNISLSYDLVTIFFSKVLCSKTIGCEMESLWY